MRKISLGKFSPLELGSNVEKEANVATYYLGIVWLLQVT